MIPQLPDLSSAEPSALVVWQLHPGIGHHGRGPLLTLYRRW
jgi:hypothetical protein